MCRRTEEKLWVGGTRSFISVPGCPGNILIRHFSQPRSAKISFGHV